VKVRIWGCRGSLAAPGPATVRYGGNTSCVEVSTETGTRIVLDAGTGIRALGAAFDGREDEPVNLLLTHLHLDHLEGLGFFAPLWTAGRQIFIWGPPSPLRALRDRVARYFSPPLFPVDLGDIPCQVVFADATPEPWAIGDVTVHAHAVQHPGPTVAYRLEQNGRTLAYFPDHEPAVGLPLDSLDDTWLSGFAAAEGADVLLHDAQYTDEEYAIRAGWGHSSLSDAITFSRRVGARRIALFHHDPSHADEQLDEIGERAGELTEGRAALAYEGMEFDI
jgi:phosphoribosyl 1,2-cyclic phosphodiesterase